jgi:hypothetical protein
VVFDFILLTFHVFHIPCYFHSALIARHWALSVSVVRVEAHGAKLTSMQIHLIEATAECASGDENVTW